MGTQAAEIPVSLTSYLPSRMWAFSHAEYDAHVSRCVFFRTTCPLNASQLFFQGSTSKTVIYSNRRQKWPGCMDWDAMCLPPVWHIPGELSRVITLRRSLLIRAERKGDSSLTGYSERTLQSPYRKLPCGMVKLGSLHGTFWSIQEPTRVYQKCVRQEKMESLWRASAQENMYNGDLWKWFLFSLWQYISSNFLK